MDQVGLDGGAGYEELLSNLGVGLVPGDEFNNAEFRWRKAGPTRSWPSPLPSVTGRVGSRLIEVKVTALL